jgi:hypothetical protein
VLSEPLVPVELYCEPLLPGVADEPEPSPELLELPLPFNEPLVELEPVCP